MIEKLLSTRSLNDSKDGMVTTEMEILRQKKDLLHSFLPEEIINTIHHNWPDHGISEDNKSTSSNINRANKNKLKMFHKKSFFRKDDPDDESIQSVQTVSSNGKNFSKALYSEDAEDVTIVFVEIVGFSEISNRIPPSDVMDMLQDLFHRFDKVCKKHNVLKLDTIGDAYIFSAGFHEEHCDSFANDCGYESGQRALFAAKEMIRVAKDVTVPCTSTDVSGKSTEFLNVRIGIHVGDVTFGVLGQSLPKLICIGKSVNMAARMEQNSKPGMIRVTKDFHDLIGDQESNWLSCEKINIKNMGQQVTYILDPFDGVEKSD